MGMCSVMVYETTRTLPGQRAMDRLAKQETITLEQANQLVSVTGRTPQAFRQKAAGAIVVRDWQLARDAQKYYVTLTAHDSYGWLRMAFILRRMENTHSAAQALEKSFTTGRYERELMLSRLTESIALWKSLTPWARSQALSDLVVLWGRERNALTATLPIDKFWPMYRRALFETPHFKSAVALHAATQSKQQHSPQ